MIGHVVDWRNKQSIGVKLEPFSILIFTSSYPICCIFALSKRHRKQSNFLSHLLLINRGGCKRVSSNALILFRARCELCQFTHPLVYYSSLLMSNISSGGSLCEITYVSFSRWKRSVFRHSLPKSKTWRIQWNPIYQRRPLFKANTSKRNA